MSGPSEVIPRLAVDVPCAGCKACCSGRTALILWPDCGDDPDDYETVSATEGFTGRIRKEIKELRRLKWAANGDCIYLGASGCSIWDRRPAACRVYDCRRHYLTLTKKERMKQMAPEIRRAARKRLSTLTQAERYAARHHRGPVAQRGDALLQAHGGRGRRAVLEVDRCLRERRSPASRG